MNDLLNSTLDEVWPVADGYVSQEIIDCSFKD